MSDDKDRSSPCNILWGVMKVESMPEVATLGIEFMMVMIMIMTIRANKKKEGKNREKERKEERKESEK